MDPGCRRNWIPAKELYPSINCTKCGSSIPIYDQFVAAIIHYFNTISIQLLKILRGPLSRHLNNPHIDINRFLALFELNI